jgi:tetratricopeptide (TPR) repeat protein
MKRLISLIGCLLVLFLLCSTALAQKTVDDFYELSQKCLMNRDIDGALAAINKAIKLEPDMAELYGRRSEFHMMKGQPQEALADLDKALLLKPDLTAAYISRGQLRMMSNDVKGALNDFDNAIAHGENSGDVYSLRANMRLMNQDPAGALSDFNTAISMNNGRVRNYLGRAHLRGMLGDKAGELADFTYVIDAYEQGQRDGTGPNEATRKMRANDIVSPVIKGPTTKGADKRKSQVKPGDTVVTTRLEMGVTMNPEAEATMSAEEMEYLPNVAGAYLNRSSIYSEKGDNDAAMADLNKSVAVFPHFLAYENRAKLWKKKGDLNAALADLSKAIERQPGMASIYCERGETLLLMGKDEEAEKDFKRCLELDPELDTMVANTRAAAKKQRAEKPQ